MALSGPDDPAAFASEQLVRLFVDGLPDHALLVLDRSGHVRSWHAGAQRIKGYAESEILGQHFSRFYLPEDRAAGKPQQALEMAERYGKFEEVGYRLRKDGSRFVANVVISPIRDARGELWGYGKITRDITERLEAEDRIKSSEKKLQNLVDTVLDTIVDGVVTIDRRGEILSYNKACVGLFGYAAEEVIGKNVRMLMPEPYHAEHDTYLQNYQTTGVAKIIGIGRAVSGRRKDGSVFPLELAVGEMQKGAEHAFVGIMRDISERRDAEQARDQLRHAQKMEALGQLTGGIAHDFNNLLAIIIGNLDLALEAVDDENLRSFLEPSLDAALHGSALTQQLLAFGRKQALQPQILSINDLLARLLTLAQRTLGERIAIKLATARDLWPVCIDPGQLENALLNVAVNARDAMPDGGKLIFETANATLDETYVASNHDAIAGDYAMIAVSDTGTGMTPEILAQAFEPFFTTKDTGKGSGLGLSMVYGFVKQSAGHIKIYSEPGHGTTIKIYLPRTDGSAGSATDGKSAAKAAQQSPAKLVLVVEDNPDVLKLTATMVGSLGYAVLTATNGDGALKIIAARPAIDLLMTDVMLAGEINGPMLAQRAVELQPHMKVLFNSGYAEQAIFERGLLDRNVQLISKPFRKPQLAAKLKEIMEG